MLSWMLGLIVYMFLCFVTIKITGRFLTAHQITAANYKGTMIPIGMGLYLWIMMLLYFMFIQLCSRLAILSLLPDELDLFTLYVFALTVIAWLGWMDDTIGNTEIKGWAAHWTHWRKHGTTSTGLCKAGGACILALWLVVQIYSSITFAILQFAVIILMTNAVNLFDLRPGRALKFYFIWTPLLMIFSTLQQILIFVLPILIAAAILLPMDLKARAMMGDTGSNLLGFSLGFGLAWTAPLWGLVTVASILIWLHWLAARGSITSMLQKQQLLNWLDNVGRA